MPTVVRKKQKQLAPAQQKVLNRILMLRPSQQERIVELVELFRHSESAEERAEISAVVAEILFPNAGAIVATPIDAEEVAGKTKKTVVLHRDYVAKQIKKHRQSLKMTQEDLAKKAGLPQSHICRLERGKHAPTHLTIEKVAGALGIRMSDLDPSYDD